MDHCLRIMNQVGTHKRTVCWKRWLSLKNPIQGFSKTHALRQWKLFSKQEWIN
ncbi:putative PB1-F2 protein [Influenza A virus]